MPRSEEAKARYENPDGDPRGDWKPSDILARNYYSKGTYTITSPGGKVFSNPTGTYWRVSKERFERLDRDGRIYWGPDGTNMPALKRFLSEVRGGVVPQTFWPYKAVGHTQEAKKELLEFVRFQHSENVLDTVKPSRLVQRMLQITTDPTEEHLILDFFAGSGPTHHAVLRQNAADGGNRRCISIQLPEPMPTREPTLTSIADIAKTRIREVIRRFDASEVSLGSELSGRPEDLGMSVFRMTSSGIRPFEVVGDSAEAYSTSLALNLDPIDPNAERANLIHEIALKEAGMTLSTRFTKVESITTNTVYRVTDPEDGRQFHICLDDHLHPDTPMALGLKGDADLFVCRDVALDDTLAANLALQCRLRTI